MQLSTEDLRTEQPVFKPQKSVALSGTPAGNTAPSIGMVLYFC